MEDQELKETQVEKQNQAKVVTFTDFLVLLLGLIYVWDWFEYPGLHVSRVVAVGVLAIWWTLFVLKLLKR